MKVTIKHKADTQDRLTLRVPASLKRAMNGTHALAERKGADYYGSIVDAIASADAEIHEKLLQMPDKVAYSSGDKAGDGSGDKISATSNSSEPPSRHINGTPTK
jgi:hypothetical protein